MFNVEAVFSVCLKDFRENGIATLLLFAMPGTHRVVLFPQEYECFVQNEAPSKTVHFFLFFHVFLMFVSFIFHVFASLSPPLLSRLFKNRG